MMTQRKKIIVLVVGTVILVSFIAMYMAGKNLSRHFESEVRKQAILYLQDRFDSQVEMSSLHITIPALSPIKTFWSKGRGVVARVDGGGLVLRHKGRKDIPPLLSLKNFRFEIDLGALVEPRRRIARVTLDGMQISIPPKESGSRFGNSEGEAPTDKRDADSKGSGTLVVEEVVATNTRLVILPKDTNRVPLVFNIYSLRLETAGRDVSMKYDAILTNPKPAGTILCKGAFGPWAAKEPGDTPLNGDYVFKDADLSVFQGIAGKLQSTDISTGLWTKLLPKGEAHVPDFRLTISGNPVPLSTTFEVGVDGTNGNTTLKPIYATLGKTHFVVSGGVIKHDGDSQKTISLKALVHKGRLEDFLLLAVKGSPMMQGEISLVTKIEILLCQVR